MVVACTQEQRLFGDLAVEAQAKTSVIKFVNIRETGGWSVDAKNAAPKIAALLAAAHLPDPEPVPTVTFKSAGRLLILGQIDEAEQAAALLADTLNAFIAFPNLVSLVLLSPVVSKVTNDYFERKRREG